MAIKISLRQIIVFREVMRCGSLSKAASTLYRSQPAVSIMIKQLEDMLGIELFVRQGNKMLPRPEAYYFAEEAENIIDKFEQTVQVIRDVSEFKVGKLRIASMPSASLFVVPSIISEFIKDKPKIKVTMQSNTSPVVHEWLASQRFDLGLAEMPMNRASLKLESYNCPLICGMHIDDVLAKKNVITPEDLSGKPMATLFTDHFTYQESRRVFAECGANFNRRFELRAFIPAYEFVEQKQAYFICEPITAVSYAIYRKQNPQIVFRPFVPEITYKFAILRPAHIAIPKVAEIFAQSFSKKLINLIESTVDIKVNKA